MNPLIHFNEINKAEQLVASLLTEFDTTGFTPRIASVSTMTKRILSEMVKKDTKNEDLKKLAISLDSSFYDEVFDNFLTITDNEQIKFLELISAYKKRIFKNKIYRNILLNHNHIHTKKMVYILTDAYKPSILKLPYIDFIDMVMALETSYIYYKKNSIHGMFAFSKMIDPTCESPFAVHMLKQLINESFRADYASSENEQLYHFLVNHFTDEEGAKYGLKYLKIFDEKSYDKRILSYIIKCKNNIQHKYRELAKELDLLLYKLYEYTLKYDDYKEIADELAMTLTNKIISEAFGDDERSIFWKQYTSSIIEPIIFVKSPVTMFMMKFKAIGIIEYIETGNATYLYSDDLYNKIKNKVLSSAVNVKNILNLNSHLSQHLLKDITKEGDPKYRKFKYVHMGEWKNQFRSDMKRNFNLYPGVR